MAFGHHIKLLGMRWRGSVRWRHGRACYDVLELTSSGVGAADSFVCYQGTKVMFISDFRLSYWP